MGKKSKRRMEIYRYEKKKIIFGAMPERSFAGRL